MNYKYNLFATFRLEFTFTFYDRFKLFYTYIKLRITLTRKSRQMQLCDYVHYFENTYLRIQI